MKSWIPRSPSASEMGDHDVPLITEHLKGKRIALVISGGIAALKTPSIARSLRRHGAEVIAYLSEEAKKYVTLEALSWATDRPVVECLSSRSEHLSKEKPFDAYLVAPATYNTINKLSSGVADTPVASALAVALTLLEKQKTKLLIAPTMHGDLHNFILNESLLKLKRRGVFLIPPRYLDVKHNIPE
jgi:phosphopantothenoylcysteine decarboxylase/phosphopantothenate--cysteine ligase